MFVSRHNIIPSQKLVSIYVAPSTSMVTHGYVF